MKVTSRRRMSLAAAALAAAAILGFAPMGARAQQGSGQQPSPQQPAEPAAAPRQAVPAAPQAEVPKINPEEEAAYKAFLAVKFEDAQTAVKLGEEFLKKYPESRYREGIYSRLANAYQTTGQEDKMFAAGEKAIELNPDSLNALVLLAMIIPRRIKAGDLDADQKLQKAQQYANHAITLLQGARKPANITDEEFTREKNDALASCHSGLGLVYYYQRQYLQMVTELEQATQLSPNVDPVDVFLLGVAYEETKRYSDAVAAFTRCSQMPGQMQNSCKQGLEQAKKQAASQPAPAKP